MTKKTLKEINSSIGSIKLGDLVLEEQSLQIIIDILDMSDELKAEIDKAIEIEKVNNVKYWEDFYNEHPQCTRYKRVWSDEPVNIFCQYLDVNLEVGKPIQYEVVVAFNDAVDDFVETDVKIPIDLSKYENELKVVFTQKIIESFFLNKN